MLTKVIKKKIGKEAHTFMVEGENFLEVMQQAQKLSFPDVYKCGNCGSDNLVLGYHKAQGKYDYITIRCRECRSSLNFGQQSEDKDTFYLKTKKDDSGQMIKDDKGFPIYDWQQFSKD
jgi:DNA-directed RNA polymerase subunit RPC12/RpoP